MLVMTEAIVTRQSAPIVPRRPYLVLVICLIAVLVALRILLLFIKPFWLDEVGSATTITAPSLAALFSHWLTKDVHPPLYLLFLYYWSKAFGISDLALRLPSLLFGLGTIAAMYFGLRKIIGEWPATVAAFIIAAAPNAILYSAEARSYTLILLLTTTALIFALRLALTRDARAVPGFTLSAIALGLTHYFGLGIAGSLYGWLILRDRRNFGLLWISGLCFVIFTAPWLIYEFPNLASKTGGHFWIPRQGIVESIVLVLGATWGETRSLHAFGLEFVVPLIAVMMARQTDRRLQSLAAELLLLLVVDLAVLVAVSQYTPLIVARYFLVFTPIAAVISAIYIASLGRLACLLITLAIPLLITLPWLNAYLFLHRFPTIAWEKPAKRLMAAKVKEVIFFLDDPINVLSTPLQLRRLGAFFFRRAGMTTKVVAVSLRSPNYVKAIEAMLASAPRPVAILKPTTVLIGYHKHDRLIAALAQKYAGQCFKIGSTQSCIFR